jgi:hypothetical protein
LTLAWPQSAAARQVVHNAAPGETLESIALRYYGVAELGESLRVHNSLGRAHLSAGSVIEIPLADDHTVANGDEWSGLADRYWGDWELGAALALLVEPAGAKLEPGTRLRIPALLHHHVRRGETMAVLTRRTYGSPERIPALALLNGIDNPSRIGERQALRLPVFGDVPEHDAPLAGSATPGSLPPVSAALAPQPPIAPLAPEEPLAAAEVPAPVAPAPLRRRPPEEDMTQVLSDAVEAYYHGEFDVARQALEELRPDLLAFGTERQQRIFFRHLLLVHVAFDDAQATCDSWTQLRGRLDDATLDPDRFSPKVRRMSQACETR